MNSHKTTAPPKKGLSGHIAHSQLITELQELLRLSDQTTSNVASAALSRHMELHELSNLVDLAKSPAIDNSVLAEFIEKLGPIKTIALYGMAGLSQDLSYATTAHSLGFDTDCMEKLRHHLRVYRNP